jgi:hypothetical protein
MDKTSTGDKTSAGDKTNTGKPQTAGQSDKRAALSAALRANLQRRKAKTRAQRAGAAEPQTQADDKPAAES